MSSDLFHPFSRSTTKSVRRVTQCYEEAAERSFESQLWQVRSGPAEPHGTGRAQVRKADTRSGRLDSRRVAGRAAWPGEDTAADAYQYCVITNELRCKPGAIVEVWRQNMGSADCWGR